MTIVQKQSPNGTWEISPASYVELRPIAGCQCAIRGKWPSFAADSLSFFPRTQSVQFTHTIPVYGGTSRLSVAASPFGLEAHALTTATFPTASLDVRLASFISPISQQLTFSLDFPSVALGALWSVSRAKSAHPRGFAFKLKHQRFTLTAGAISAASLPRRACIFCHMTDARDRSSRFGYDIHVRHIPGAASRNFSLMLTTYVDRLNFSIGLTLEESAIAGVGIFYKRIPGFTFATGLSVDSHDWRISWTPILKFEPTEPATQKNN
jgi:hypothetical protein